VVSERTVRAAARAGQPVTLAAGDRVTPAARDLARSLGVALVPAHPAAPAGEHGAPAVVALGADHGGFRLKESLKPAIAALRFGVVDVGCHGTESVDYPVFAARVAELVARGEARFGVMVDGAGIGSAMVANKIDGVRAALCYDLTTAKNAREHNDANVLTLGGTLIGERLAGDIVSAFLTTGFGGGRHERRVAMIRALDRST
jgi:ribose 5-phosphate isomerase B